MTSYPPSQCLDAATVPKLGMDHPCIPWCHNVCNTVRRVIDTLVYDDDVNKDSETTIKEEKHSNRSSAAKRRLNKVKHRLQILDGDVFGKGDKYAKRV